MKREEKLFNAIKCSDFRTLNRLLSKSIFHKPLDINLKYNFGNWSLLHLAINSHSKKEIIELLISKGANINVYDKENYSPLTVAIINNRIDCVELLVSKGAKVDEYVGNAGFRIQKIYHFLKKGCPLHIAVIFENKEMIEKLITLGAKINTIALYGENKSDLEPSKIKSITFFNFALSVFDSSFCNLLIERGADINAKDNAGRTPIYLGLSMESGNFELLLNKGADINTKDNNGKSPLHYFAENYRIYDKLIDLLLSKGADVNLKDNYGKSPLHYLAENPNRNGIELFLSKGADVNLKDNYGKSPLHYLAENPNRNWIELFLSKGADFNMKDENEITPISILAKKDKKLAIEIQCINHEIEWCKCKNCGTVMNENHNWDGCKCKECGAVRNENHNMDGCKCLKCGIYIHDWHDHKCKKCGEIEPNEYLGYYE